MSLFLAIAAGVLLAAGFAGTFVPVLPGAPLAWLGLLAAYFSEYCDISVATLIITGIAAVLVSVLDNILPVAMTKKFGGSKSATTGSTIGLIAGFFIGPVGIILGPFLGAVIGELIHNHGNSDGVLRAGLGAFAGFLAGTGIKMILVLVLIWCFIAGFF
ncbi:MAG: DUF456 domain-containing protein [Treponema sp.]|nr:DUF456 domain-containing protein [Treponema sp.]